MLLNDLNFVRNGFLCYAALAIAIRSFCSRSAAALSSLSSLVSGVFVWILSSAKCLNALYDLFLSIQSSYCGHVTLIKIQQ